MKKAAKSNNVIKIAQKVLATESCALGDMGRRLNATFSSAVDLIHQSQGRVIVTGMGKSGLVGAKIAATLASTGTPAYFMHPAEASHGDLGMVTPDDIVLAISNSGETDEIIELLPYLKRFGVRLISMAGNPKSTLSKSADVHLDVSVKEEACPMGIVPTASTTAAMAMGDALAVALLIKRGFREADFAAFHPKGALGKKLLTRVSDLMHKSESVPRVMPDTPMSEAVIEMSAKRLGLTTVIDKKNGSLKGIITDGDLRRGIQKLGRAVFEKNAGEVMTADPKFIGPDELATKALSIMQDNSITALLVMDNKRRPVGIIHIHDILKAGII